MITLQCFSNEYESIEVYSGDGEYGELDKVRRAVAGKKPYQSCELVWAQMY